MSTNVRMTIAKGTRECTPADAALGSLANLQQTFATKTFKGGLVDLNHLSNFPDPGFRDTSHVGFGIASYNLASPLFAATTLDSQPLGACVARPTQRGDRNPLALVSALDAGSTFTIKGPGGTVTVTVQPFERITLSATAGTFLVPGDYTIAGAGGKDVGPFTAVLNVPISPTLTSPSANGFTVSRARGMTVTWNGNGSTGHVELVLESQAAGNIFSNVACTVAASAGTFTIPSHMLFTLANTNNAIFTFSLGKPATSAAFSASGVDAGFALFYSDGVGFGFSITN